MVGPEPGFLSVGGESPRRLDDRFVPATGPSLPAKFVRVKGGAG